MNFVCEYFNSTIEGEYDKFKIPKGALKSIGTATSVGINCKRATGQLEMRNEIQLLDCGLRYGHVTRHFILECPKGG